jgi:hypothetical protein
MTGSCGSSTPTCAGRPLRTSTRRARITRELHDVISHGLSVVVLQTLAARGLLADLPASAGAREEVDRHLGTAEETAQEALAEMRRMLGLLQNVGEYGQTADPGVHQLLDLVDLSGARSSCLVRSCPPHRQVLRLLGRPSSERGPSSRGDGAQYWTTLVGGPASSGPDSYHLDDLFCS